MLIEELIRERNDDTHRLDVLESALVSAFPAVYKSGKVTVMLNLKMGGRTVHVEADTLREAIDQAIAKLAPPKDSP